MNIEHHFNVKIVFLGKKPYILKLLLGKSMASRARNIIDDG
ncbi:MAG: hypothetical protein QW716_00165 [Desulfurococcaceae archaeon]